MRYETTTLAVALFIAGKMLDVDAINCHSDDVVSRIQAGKPVIVSNNKEHIEITFVPARDCYVAEYHF